MHLRWCDTPRPRQTTLRGREGTLQALSGRWRRRRQKARQARGVGLQGRLDWFHRADSSCSRLEDLAVAQRVLARLGVAPLLEQSAGFLETRVRLPHQDLPPRRVIRSCHERDLFGGLLEAIQRIARQGAC